MNGTTEFLAKSLVAAGAFLAIPATLAVVLALLAFGISFPHIRANETLWALGVIAFCASGFFLLVRTIRFVRAPDAVLLPSWLWPAVTIYLLIIVGLGVSWLLNTYSLARAAEWRSWGGDEIEADLLVVPAVALLLPIWAVVLSSALWMRHALTRNA
jgi:hypothetical protein